MYSYLILLSSTKRFFYSLFYVIWYISFIINTITLYCLKKNDFLFCVDFVIISSKIELVGDKFLKLNKYTHEMYHVLFTRDVSTLENVHGEMMWRRSANKALPPRFVAILREYYCYSRLFTLYTCSCKYKYKTKKHAIFSLNPLFIY